MPKLWSISGLMSFLRFGGAEKDDRAEDLVRSGASSSSNDEDEDLQVQEQEGPPHIPGRQVQLDRNSAPEFVFPLPPGDVPPGHEVCSLSITVWSDSIDSRRVAFAGTSLPTCLGCSTTGTFQWDIPPRHARPTASL